ncbi:uncharacterized protein LOC107042390 [Diachasma alloeum]|uniref:uncharacterized protein LOC107042390 n=1 Tax=Diachasma alloeum TaxID=454923 RepID=UPI0007383B6E|nr:uncharacterized protein LOC107042390 [Diachasma alloeum]
MAHGVGEVVSESNSSVKKVNNTSMRNHNNAPKKIVGVMGSRRIFAAAFKLKVLDSYRSDIECRGNQRATARKYGIHRRQIQKWLQCEKNLRSNCTNNANGNGVIVSKSFESISTVDRNGINIINTSVSKIDEPIVVTTSSGKTAAAPVAAASAAALNLSLARLHGDELTARQGLPAHSSSHHGSTTSVQYTQHTLANTLPMHTLLMGYTEYSGEDLHLHHEHHLPHHRLEDNRIHDYKINSPDSPTERKYDVVNHSTYEQSISDYLGRSNAPVYLQPNRASYLTSLGPCTYYCTVNKHQRILESNIYQSCSHISPPLAPLSISPPQSHSHLNDVDSPGDECLAPAIKMERASPDSLATPVSCDEAPNSPGATTTTTPMCTINNHTYTPTSGIATHTFAAEDIHFQTPRRISPGTHVHLCVDAQTSMDFKEKEYHSKLMYIEREDGETIMMKDEESDMYVPSEENVEGQKENCVTSNNRNESIYNIVSGVKYDTSAVPLLQSNSEIGSGTSSPVRHSNYSNPLSSKGTAGICCRSISSCSDGEIDPTDYSPSHQNHNGDSSRRRSFSLRFKLDVLDAFHGDAVVARNQRATARKFGINRRQVQKWLGQEIELRGEIALRGGDLRQRLGPLQELSESAIDLRTSSHSRSDIEMVSSSSLYCCAASSQRFNYYPSISVDCEGSQNTCTASCCTKNLTSSVTSCYSELKRTCYPESQRSYYCYSPNHAIDTSISKGLQMNSSPSKQTVCTFSICYDAPSSQSSCAASTDIEWDKDVCQDQPLQEAPLCLVKEKYLNTPSPLQTERVTSTVRTPPAPAVFAPSSKKDAILFKPYLDNPVKKSTDDRPNYQRYNLSTLNSHQNVTVNNNNCGGICNFNDEPGHDYAVELSLRVPVSWHAPSHITEFPEPIPSAFARYSAIPHFI